MLLEIKLGSHARRVSNACTPTPALGDSLSGLTSLHLSQT